MENILERFLRYVRINTQSAAGQPQIPSTPGQFDLARLLVKELQEMGLEASVNENCYVYATLPGSRPDAPVIGFISHLDTSPALSGADIHPRLVTYQGGDIELGNGYALKLETNPELKRYLGKTLVVTDGSTLLGSDDKSGIAEIMTMAQYFVEHPEQPHGTVKIAFTPDEEIGLSPTKFDIPGFGAQFAYTVDGADLGKLSYQNFNSAKATIRIHGTSIHPGRAKDKMTSAVLVAVELQNMLPPAQAPAHTAGYEGFFHLMSLTGDVESATMDYRISDHDSGKFAQKKARMEAVCAYLNEKYGAGTVELTLEDTAQNMEQMILPHFHLIENAMEAMRRVDVEPEIFPIRGGTDGTRLSFMGLPCPNLNTGSHNCHGRFEYVPVFALEKISQMLVELVKLYAETKA